MKQLLDDFAHPRRLRSSYSSHAGRKSQSGGSDDDDDDDDGEELAIYWRGRVEFGVPEDKSI